MSRAAGHDLRMALLALPAWASAWLATASATWAWVVIGAGLLVGVVLVAWRRAPIVVGCVLVAASLALSAGARAALLTHGPLGSLGRDQAYVTAVVELRGDVTVRPAAGVKPPYGTGRVTVLEVEGRGSRWTLREPVLLVVTGAGADAWSRVAVGSRLRVSGRLQPPDRGSGLAAVLRTRAGPDVVRAPGRGLALVERVRTGLRQAVAGRAAEPRALVPALVLGDTSRVEPGLEADFRATGLTHLTAVSGANLTLLLAFLLLFARWVGVRGRGLRVAGLAAVVVFVGLCRTEPSVLRAAAMGLVALAALGAGGRRAGLRNLSVAVTVLLLADPFLARSLGFTLSVLASGGIIAWARPWAAAMAWLPAPVAEAVAVPLAAHLATLPVVAAVSGQVSLIGLVANAVAGPFVGPATVLGFAAAGLSLVWAPLAAVAGFGAAWSAQVIIWVAHLGAALPGATRPWPVTPVTVGYLVALAAVGAALTGLVLVRAWLVALLSAAMVAGLLLPPLRPGWPPDDWLLVACDVGQGDGLVVRSGPRQAVVVDAGPDPAAIDRCLDQLRVRRVPLLVLTHFHDDHVAGLTGVLQGRPVGQIWVSPLPTPAGEAAVVRRVAADHHVPVLTPAVGTAGSVGAIGWRVLGPVAGPAADVAAEGESGQQNDASLVLMLTVGGTRLLLTGDVEPPGQQAILATGADLHADVLKVPHHGSARQDQSFLAATHARIAVASAGVDNDYGHPAPSTVARLRALGMTVLATNEHGAIGIAAHDGTLTVTAER